MKRLLIPLLLIFAATAWARLGMSPMDSQDGGFLIVVEDNDVDSGAFELVTQDTGFTQLTGADSTIKVTYLGSNLDTALVHIIALRGNVANSDSLRRYETRLKVGGGDTVATDSTFNLYQGAWLDTSKASAVIVFSQMSSARNTLLDTIAANRIWQPNAHVFFAKGESGYIDYVAAYLTTETADVTCEFRTYHSITKPSFDYTQDYDVRAKVILSSATGESFQEDWGGRGILVGQGAAAWMCQGAANDADVAVVIKGRRY